VRSISWKRIVAIANLNILILIIIWFLKSKYINIKAIIKILIKIQNAIKAKALNKNNLFCFFYLLFLSSSIKNLIIFAKYLTKYR